MKNAINIKLKKNEYVTNIFKLRSVIDYTDFNPQDIFTHYLKKYKIEKSKNYKHHHDNIFIIGGQKYLLALVRDTSHEPENKRVQGNNFLPARDEGVHLLGLYPIKNTNPQEFVFIEWKNSELRKYEGRNNPAVKVKIQNILRVLDPTQPIANSRIKYESSIFTEDEFWK